MNNEKIIKWSRPVEILLVDDNPADVVLTREVFQDGKLLRTLENVLSSVVTLPSEKIRCRQ
jgi:hypothetical protein